MGFIKIDDQTFKETQPAPSEIIHVVSDLKSRREVLAKNLILVDDPDAIKVRKANIQSQIDKIDAQLAGGESVGVADAAPSDISSAQVILK